MADNSELNPEALECNPAGNYTHARQLIPGSLLSLGPTKMCQCKRSR